MVRKPNQMVALLAGVWSALADQKEVEIPPIVSDFTYVFPNELPDSLPPREMEFTINILPGTAPIAIPLYRMAQAEQI